MFYHHDSELLPGDRLDLEMVGLGLPRLVNLGLKFGDLRVNLRELRRAPRFNFRSLQPTGRVEKLNVPPTAKERVVLVEN